jgi:hypothetical protein
MGTDTKILHIQWRTGIFLKKVKSKRTDEYFQAEGFLIKRELVPSDRQPTHVDTKDKPLKYLIKSVIALSEKGWLTVLNGLYQGNVDMLGHDWLIVYLWLMT